MTVKELRAVMDDCWFKVETHINPDDPFETEVIFDEQTNPDGWTSEIEQAIVLFALADFQNGSYTTMHVII